MNAIQLINHWIRPSRLQMWLDMQAATGATADQIDSLIAADDYNELTYSNAAELIAAARAYWA